MTSPTADRLLELLEIRDQQLTAAQQQIEELSHKLGYGVDWMLHSRPTEAAEIGLPVPRIQLRLAAGDDFSQEWELALVYADLGGYRRSRVPLQYSKRSGGPVGDLPAECESDAGRRAVQGVMPGLFVDLCHASKTMKLPAYTVIGALAIEVTSLQPPAFAYVTRSGA